MSDKTIKNQGKPLHQEEIPTELQQYFDFSKQQLVFSQAKKTRAMMIPKRCGQCCSVDYVRVSYVKQAIREGKLSGLCKRCSFHKNRSVRPSGESHYNWKGGKRTDPKGYVHIRRPEHPNANMGYVQEHRLVMEQSLDRLLLPTETVHHKNGIKSDNRIENLELWSKSHSDGCRYDDLSVEQLEDLIEFLQKTLAQKSNEAGQ